MGAHCYYPAFRFICSARINTVLELKIEHEVLSQRLAELRLIKAQRGPGPSTTPPSSHTRTPHHAQLPKTPRSPSEFRYYNLSYPVVATGSEYAQGFEEEEDVLFLYRNALSLPTTSSSAIHAGGRILPNGAKVPPAPRRSAMPVGYAGQSASRRPTKERHLSRRTHHSNHQVAGNPCRRSTLPHPIPLCDALRPAAHL